MEYSITAEKRTETGTKACNAIRANGKMPAVIYGAGGENENITISTKEFEKVWREAGESTIITLKGLDEEKAVLIQDVTLEPLYDTPLHADLYMVKTDQAVSVEVPLVFTGVAPAEKELGGNLMKVMHIIAVEALPKDLPSEIEVDISALKTFSDKILVKDVKLPDGVVATADADEVIALVQEAHEEEVYETEETEDGGVGDVEVEKKGKEESDSEKTDGE
jgi:large subunit ribosomal protein L25